MQDDLINYDNALNDNYLQNFINDYFIDSDHNVYKCDSEIRYNLINYDIEERTKSWMIY